MSFAQSEFLFLALLLPLACWAIFRIYLRNQKILQLAFVNHGPFNKQISQGKTLLRCLALISLFLAFLGPYTQSSNAVPLVGREIYFLLDVSGSMHAQDLSPSRLHKAKRVIRQLIRKLQGNKMGLIVFSDDAYLQCPLTLDYEMLELMLQLAGTQQFSREGTQFRPALALALEHLSPKESSYARKNQAVVLLSDGEDHGDAFPSIVDRIKKRGIKIYSVGIGTLEGAPVPHYQSKNFLRDKQGAPIRSVLQDSSLKAIAKSSRTSYLAISQSYQSPEKIFEQIDQQLMAPVDRERMITQNTMHEPLLILGLFSLILNLFLLPSSPDSPKVYL